jgi:hypothetical protein
MAKAKKVVDVPKGKRIPYGWEQLTGKKTVRKGMYCRRCDSAVLPALAEFEEWEEAAGLIESTAEEAGRMNWIVIRKARKLPKKKTPKKTWRGKPVKSEEELRKTPNDLPPEHAYDNLWEVDQKVVDVPKGTRIPYGWEKVGDDIPLQVGMYLLNQVPSARWFAVAGWEGRTTGDLNDQHKFKLVAIRRQVGVKKGTVRVVVYASPDQMDDARAICQELIDGLPTSIPCTVEVEE